MYKIPKGGDSTMDVDWTNLYGKLEPGTYRICKSVFADGKEYKIYGRFFVAG